MKKHSLFPTSTCSYGTADIESCLSINTARPEVGLFNLLEIAEHRIEVEGTEALHTLTFRSGRCLRIHSDGQVVTVVGRKINFHPSEVYPFNTLLGEPGG